VSRIEELLDKALLVRERRVPRDIVPPPTPQPPAPVSPIPQGSTSPAAATAEAAQDLRALCETFVTHTPATAVADFITEQVPQPRSALVLACVLELTDTREGARFWWQYAAGAGQPAAAYCLYLHHLAAGEDDTARWWHCQSDAVQDLPAPAEAAQHEPDTHTAPAWHPAAHTLESSSTTTMLRILRHLSKSSPRPHRPASVSDLMAYLPTAVASGYLREPEADLPLPGTDFADRVTDLLTGSADRPGIPDSLPARRACRKDAPRPAPGRPARQSHPAALPQTSHR
jgi:hypothetical protein